MFVQALSLQAEMQPYTLAIVARLHHIYKRSSSARQDAKRESVSRIARDSSCAYSRVVYLARYWESASNRIQEAHEDLDQRTQA